MRLNDAIAVEQRRKMATAEKSSAVGDCAKLREALGETLAYIESFHKYITPGKGKKLTALFAVADTIRDKLRAALAAPPRNCEKYATVDKAMYDFGDEALIEEWNALKAGKDRDMLAEELFMFAKWLFAPATEKEGGDNAD